MGVCTKERKGVTAEVLLPLPALIHWEVKAGHTSMKEVGGAGFAGERRVGRWKFAAVCSVLELCMMV